MDKKYGLIKPNNSKKPTSNFTKPSIFGDESSDDDEKPQKIGLTTMMQKKQAQLIQEKALAEDATVYQYDELYDDISAKKLEEKAKKSEDKKPKYITRLLQTAEKRKIENERRIERKVQKERDEEGEMYKDKEAFVTASYRKKLEELKKAEEEEEREEYLEAIGDVRKQGNLDGFYRHIFSQKTENEKPIVKPEMPEKKENEEGESSSTSKENNPKSRSYRKRRSSEKSDDENAEVDEAKKIHLQNNLDADSDFSIESDSSDDDKEQKPVITKVAANSDEPPEFVRPSDPVPNPIVKSEPNGKEDQDMQEEIKEVLPKKEKIDIWKKRTVGEAFDEALKKYYERKAIREQMSQRA